MNFFFDLDGVLVDFRNLHKDAFCQAWNMVHVAHPISHAFHTTHLEAQSTRQKIAYLAAHFGIDPHTDEVSGLKQQVTQSLLAFASTYKATSAAVEYAHSLPVGIACCSNSVKSTVLASLAKVVPLSHFKVILSNEDVENPKPAPDIYVTALEKTGAKAENTIVFEDSEVGKKAGKAAGLRVIDIVDALDVTPAFLAHVFKHGVRPTPPSLNVVIPMAGLGSRFVKDGYTTPKPFLPLFGKPMFETVIRNVVPASLFDRTKIHIIVREEHLDLFKAHPVENVFVHTVPKLTEGATCTVLTVRDLINNDTPLIIANSDQYLEWDAENFVRALYHPDWDGVISTFLQEDPTDLRWSYANVNGEGEVTKVAEKKFIGPLATTGIYGWKRGSDFVADAESMIAENVRVNGEFYVCPVYNTTVARGGRIRTHNCEKMWGLGVPADYEYFKGHFKGKIN